MVIAQKSWRRRERGLLNTDMMVAMGILTLAIMPLAFTFFQEVAILRGSYQKSVAMELIDGEMEVLLAGEWRTFQPGRQAYPLHGAAQTNLPPGTAYLTITGQKARLEWLPQNGKTGVQVVREGVLR